VPEAHRAFLRSLPLCHRAGGLLFVHAGIDPQKPLDAQTPQDMLWIREPFLTWRGGLPVLVVHGHTPVERPRHFGHRVALDGGAGFGRPLMPAVFEDDAGWLLTEAGREPLTPPPAPR